MVYLSVLECNALMNCDMSGTQLSEYDIEGRGVESALGMFEHIVLLLRIYV